MKYSFIIPVYNRPDEVDELLDSLTRLKLRDFEVIVVEDGSSVSCKEVVDRYADRLPIHIIIRRIPALDKRVIMVWNVPMANIC